MQDNQAQTLQQRDFLHSTADFYRTTLESMRQLMDVQTRTMASLASRQATVAGHYWSETMGQLTDPSCFNDPQAFISKQSGTMRAFGRRAMDGALEVAEDTVELLAKSRDEMDRMMEEMSKTAAQGMQATQENIRDLSKSGNKTGEKAPDRSGRGS